MANRKGMSQVLGLIITASVLIMAAAILMFLFTDIGTEEADWASCQQTVRVTCMNADSYNGDMPAPCDGFEDRVEEMSITDSATDSDDLVC